MGEDRPIFFFELAGDTVWGATAAMLRQVSGSPPGPSPAASSTTCDVSGGPRNRRSHTRYLFDSRSVSTLGVGSDHFIR